MRDYKITRNEGEWYHARVTDSYGNKYDNYFEYAHEANKWIYFVYYIFNTLLYHFSLLIY